MKARETRFRGFEDYCRYIAKEHHAEWWRWYYRGHSKPNYRLLPKVGRGSYGPDVRDDRLFKNWKRHAIAYVPSPASPLSTGDWLAIAQHHGLATRLLDWTFNSLNAAFFAVVDTDGEISTDHDAVIYAHYSNRKIESISDREPFALKGIQRLSSSAVTPRIGRQGGIFTIHGPATLDLEIRLPQGDKLERLIIDKSCKRAFAKTLSHHGVNRQALFPDLDGLSKHINWVFTHLFHE